MTLKITGLDKTIKALEKVSNIDKKADKILYKLAEKGQAKIDGAYETIQIDYDIVNAFETPIIPSIKTSINPTQNGVELVGEGEDIAFYEFGAGIQKNTPRDWNNVLNVPVPDWVSPIGTYGKGKGSQHVWVYHKDGKFYMTHGIEARRGFAEAINEIVAEKENVTREVLNE